MGVDGAEGIRTTRTGRVIVYLAVLLVALSVLYTRPLLLVGSAGLGAWLIAHALDFRWRVGHTLESLTIEQQVGSPEVRIEETREVTVVATADQCYVPSLAVRSTLPLGIRKRSEEPARLTPEEPRAKGTVVFEGTKPGRHSLGPFRLGFRDRYGLFTFGHIHGSSTEIEITEGGVSPHVGQGGVPHPPELPPNAITGVRNDIGGSELVKYHPGDDASRIDWKVSARMGDTYIRDDTSDQNEVPTVTVIVDGRSSMFAGPAGRSKLQYVPAVLDRLLDLAQIDGVPVGGIVVTEGQTDVFQEPHGGAAHYDAIRERVATLAHVPRSVRGRRTGRGLSTGASQRVVKGLFSGRGRTDSAFDTKLRPFLRHRSAGGQSLSPLVDAVAEAAESSSGRKKAVVFTDDVRTDEVREAARTANQRGLTTDVYLLPDAAFETLSENAGPGDQAREQFVRLERFRDSVSFPPHVRAFELCPEEWIESVSGRTGRRRPSSDENSSVSRGEVTAVTPIE